MCELTKEEELTCLLSSFACEQDKDIEHFLKYRAIEFEQLAKSRTYLVCDRRELITKDISGIIIYGYISVGLKVLTVQETVSNRVRKNWMDLVRKFMGKRLMIFHVI